MMKNKKALGFERNLRKEGAYELGFENL